MRTELCLYFKNTKLVPLSVNHDGRTRFNVCTLRIPNSSCYLWIMMTEPASMSVLWEYQTRSAICESWWQNTLQCLYFENTTLVPLSVNRDDRTRFNVCTLRIPNSSRYLWIITCRSPWRLTITLFTYYKYDTSYP